MPSTYPGTLDTLATDKTNETAQNDDHPDHHNDLADAVNKIEAELGTTPSAAFSTVAARIADGETNLSNHLADTSDAHDASAISIADSGAYFTATDVEGALQELGAGGGGGGSPSGSAGGVLDGTYPNPGLAASVAGDGLSESSNVLAVNVDGSTVEISSDSLRVKDGGITSAKIADGTITTTDLAFDPATQTELDAHITDSTDAHDASAISIADSGGYYAGTETEAALQEVGSSLAAINAAALSWVSAFSESGSSLTNWTQDSGSWSVVSSAFDVDATAPIDARLKFNTDYKAHMDHFVLSADVKIKSSGLVNNSRAGIMWGWDGTGTGAPLVQLFNNAGAAAIRAEFNGLTNVVPVFTPSPSWAADTFATLMVVVHGTSASIFLNGVFLTAGSWNNNTSGNSSRGGSLYVGLEVNTAKAAFQNIKMQYVSRPSGF